MSAELIKMLNQLEDGGCFLVLRINGRISLEEGKATINKIHRAIGCDCCDTVLLDRNKEIIMMVDDTGLVDDKPVNDAATRLVRSVFGPTYPHSIHGDVAIVNDKDFA